MTKWAIRKLARAKILEGKNRQQAYEEIVRETKEDHERVAKLVRFVPSLRTRNKYKTLNTIFGLIVLIMALLTAIVVVSLTIDSGSPGIIALTLVFPILMVILSIAVFQFRVNQYSGIGVFGIISILKSFQNKDAVVHNEYMYIGYAVSLTIIILAFYLVNQMSSNYTVSNVKKEENGKTRLVKLIQFPEDDSLSTDDSILDQQV